MRGSFIVGALFLASCTGGATTTSTAPSASSAAGRADIGGYSLAYQCEGSGSPTVILEAGYTASGIGSFGETIQPALAGTTRVCTYDRAGVGVSDARPASVTPLTSVTQARELHAMLDAIGEGPFVYVGHSYGGMIARAFAATYPDETVGLVLLDASSEPEIPVYDRMHAGPWDDGTVFPAPNQRIDIHTSVRELEQAPSLGAMPLIVVTAGILDSDKWLKKVPTLEARAQTRLASLSSNSIHVVDRGKGHFLPDNDPKLVIDATRAVVQAARLDSALAPCRSVFSSSPTALCVAPGALARQVVPPG